MKVYLKIFINSDGASVLDIIKIAEETVLSFAETDRNTYKYIAEAQAAIGDFDAALESLQSAIQSYWDNAYKVEMASKGKQGVAYPRYTDTVMSAPCRSGSTAIPRARSRPLIGP